MASDIQAWLDAVNTLREYLGYGYREYTEADTEETLRQELLILQLMAKQQGREAPSSIATDVVTSQQPANLAGGRETTSKSFPQIPPGLAPGAEAPAPSTPELPTIISQGGYDWMWQEGYKDEPGTWIMIGESQQQGMSDFQRRQIELDESKQRDLNIGRQVDAMSNALQFESQRQSLRSEDIQRSTFLKAQSGMARAFEDWKNRLENSPRNFFMNQMIRSQSNPFQASESGLMSEEREIAQQKSKNLSSEIKDAKQQLKDAYTRELDSGSPMDKATIAGLEKRFEDLTAEKAATDKWVQNYGQTGTVVGGTPEQQAAYEASGRPDAPSPDQNLQPVKTYDIPKELQPLIGGTNLTGNQLVTNPLLTPSAQMLNRMSPTSLQQLYGLYDVREETPEDMLASIESMLPIKRTTKKYSAARQV